MSVNKGIDWAEQERNMTDFHFPRYRDLPDIELYMDQVISFIENKLAVFVPSEKEKLLSSSMVNNYVKQNVIPPPKNKKYAKNHVAYLFCICILKKILTILEIKQLLSIQMENWPVEAAYDSFCEEVEAALDSTFHSGDFSVFSPNPGEDEASKILRSAALSFANRVYLERLICSMEKPAKDKNQKA